MARYSGKKCRLVTMFGLTSGFFLVEIIVGYVTNSMALVADSFHMLSDIAALLIAFLSVKMAPKSWDKNTYGWARAEVLGALVNAVFLRKWLNHIHTPKTGFPRQKQRAWSWKSIG